jgi:hypothetical protein
MMAVGTEALDLRAFTHLGQSPWFRPQYPTYPPFVVVATA